MKTISLGFGLVVGLGNRLLAATVLCSSIDGRSVPVGSLSGRGESVLGLLDLLVDDNEQSGLLLSGKGLALVLDLLLGLFLGRSLNDGTTGTLKEEKLQSERYAGILKCVRC